MRTYPMSWVYRWAAALALLLFALSAAQAQDAKPFGKEQLDQMTAQVALYPDSLLAQLFMATTYPDDLAAAVAWSKAHPDAKGDDAVTMVENEPWDPSVASMVAFPEVLITLGDKPDWVRNMGDAFLAQPEDVMDSVQRLRAQAQAAGNLKSNEQVKVSTQPAEPTPTTTVVQQAARPPEVIVIEPAQPSVVYVPAYNPAVVYGAWAYPAYPPYYYPPPPGYWFSRAVATGIAWGVGIGITNALWGGCNWGRGDVNINVNRYNNINVKRRIDGHGNRANWNHNPGHRGKTPYRGGDQTRQRLDKKHQAGNREQYRGRDASRDANRERAARAMQDRGVDAGRGSAKDRAQTMQRDRSQQRPQTMNRSTARDRAQGTDRGTTRDRAQSMDRSAARDRAQGTDRSAARDRAQSMDRDATRNRAQSADRAAARQRAQAASRDNALRGANSPQARAQFDRGAASRASAQRARGGGASNRGGGASSRGGGASSRGGGAGARARGGGGGRSGGGGGRGGGGRGR